MRRALAAAVLGISLWLGSLAWTGFVLLHTVLDPGRSEAVAESLYEDEDVRAQLVENIADGVEAALGPVVPVRRETVEATATAALDSPAVEALFIRSLVRTHRAFLGEGDPPSGVDAGAFGTAARSMLVEAFPGLDAVLPESPELAVPLPTDGVPDASPVRDALLAAVPLLAVASALGVVLAVAVTSDRPAVVRRAGLWAMGLSAMVLLVAYGMPALADRYASGQSAVIGALVRAMAGTLRVPALALAGLGAAAVVGSLVWRRSAAFAPPPVVVAPRRRRSLGTSTGRVVMPQGRRSPPTRLPDGDAPGAHRVGPPPPPGTREAARAEPTVVSGPDPDLTRVEGAPVTSTQWVDGVGWVVEGSGPIPPGARWVPGVGYVVDER